MHKIKRVKEIPNMIPREQLIWATTIYEDGTKIRSTCPYNEQQREMNAKIASYTMSHIFAKYGYAPFEIGRKRKEGVAI
jgi:hypothetical protein